MLIVHRFEVMGKTRHMDILGTDSSNELENETTTESESNSETDLLASMFTHVLVKLPVHTPKKKITKPVKHR